MTKTDAISFFSNTTAVAEFLGISQAAVSQWNEIIPEKQALRLEKLTKGKLKYDAKLYTTTVS